jgi:hypothetical protein
MALERAEPWSLEDIWPPNDTEESCLGTNLHQTTITNLRWGLNEAARVCQVPGRPLPWTALSQTLLLGCQRPDGSYYRTYPDLFVYLSAVDPNRGSMSVGADGPPALIVEVVSESTFDTDVGHVRGKGYSYARAGVPEYVALDPTGQYIAGVAAWRLEGERYGVWPPDPDRRWHSAQLPIAIALEGAQAVVYLSSGQRMLAEGEVEAALAAVETALAEKDAELARKDAEIDRLRRLLKGDR